MSYEAAQSGHGLRWARTFDDIVGQPNAVKGLRERVRAGHKTIGVILHGPPGVGKRTMARLYAKSVLCEEPTEEGSFCDSCLACSAFDANASADSIVYDMAPPELNRSSRDKAGVVEKAARAIVKRAAGQPWGRRRAITLINVDSAPPRAFDRLLATLEEARAPTTFILSACNLRNVRLAGVSRCDHFGLRPLAPEAAGSLLAPRLHALGARPDEEALDVLIAAGKGLPTRLNEICVQMAGRGALTLAVVRQTLDLNWIEEIAAHWRTVLSGKAAIYDALALSMNVAPEEQVRRRQAFLQHIYLHGLRGIPMSTIATEPAFLHRGKSFTGDLVQALKTYAESRGMSAEDIWYTLTRDCLAGDLAEAVAGTSQTPI